MNELGARYVGLRAWAALAVLVCCLLAAPVAAARSKRAFDGVRYAKIGRACQLPKPGHAACSALVRIPVSSAAAGESGVKPYTAGAGALESGPTGGFTPAELASAYGFDPAAGGSGQTIAIVDAYDDPNIESDLETFDGEYGIAPCTTNDGCFRKVSQTGSATELPSPDTTGWSVEISLDVEMAHSTCPQCKILLVEAESSSLENLSAAVGEAVKLGATEVSNSYGGPEGELGPAEKADYNHPGVMIAAAAGDNGYDDWNVLNQEYEPPGRPNIPASLPTVVAVGGTTLYLEGDGKRESERVWNGNGPLDETFIFDGLIEGATGGGCSTLFTAQPWQLSAPGWGATGCGSKRLSADVAADADPYTGFDIYDSYDCGEECEDQGEGEGWLTIGGTSLSTPLISGLYALAGGSHGVSYPALTLYGHLGDSASLYDVTEGGNGFCDAEPEPVCGHPDAYGALVEGYALQVDCEYTTACNAAPGYDGPSGVGTPSSLSLFEPLLPTAAITPPASLRVGTPAAFGAGGSVDPNPGATLSYAWNWGDGTPVSGGAAPQHTYAATGDYTVTLTVTDSYGLTSPPATQLVNVGEAAGTGPGVKTETGGSGTENGGSAKQSGSGSQEVSGFKSSLAPPVPDAQLAGVSLQVSTAGLLTLKISCPAGETSCSGTIALRTLGAVIAANGHGVKQKPAVLTLATGSFTVAGGKLRAITLHLSSKARTLLARLLTLRARATLLAHDPQGASHTTSTIVTLHLARPAHHHG
jgi:hypothetical protein